MSLPQPYRTDYTGEDPQLAMLFQHVDEMLDILFNAAGSGSASSQTFVAGNGITINVAGTTVTISLTNPSITLAQVSARVVAAGL